MPATMSVRCRDLGHMDYAACWELQRQLFEALLARKKATTGEDCSDKRPGAAVDAMQHGTGNPATDGLASDRAGDVMQHGTGSPATDGLASDRAGDAGTILFVEHPPVYTLGKSGHAENLLIDRNALEALGAKFFHIDRGGDITFHGPGQIVCYPILDLERIGIGLRAYIEALEEAVIRTVACYGVRAGRIAGASGVWIGGGAVKADDTGATEANGGEAIEASGTGEGRFSGAATAAGNGRAEGINSRPKQENSGTSPENSGSEKENSRPEQENSGAEQESTGRGPKNNGPGSVPRKICAIGVRSSRYVTMHGFALNVTTDLRWFSRINPCGFRDRGVTSLSEETGRIIPANEVRDLLVKFLSEILNVKIYNS